MAQQAPGQDLLGGAIAAYKDGRIDEAFDLAGQAIEAAPSDPTGFFVRGTVFEHRQEYDEALGDYNRVVELSPRASTGLRPPRGAVLQVGPVRGFHSRFRQRD